MPIFQVSKSGTGLSDNLCMGDIYPDTDGVASATPGTPATAKTG
jgi:hypothetical protein